MSNTKDKKSIQDRIAEYEQSYKHAEKMFDHFTYTLERLQSRYNALPAGDPSEDDLLTKIFLSEEDADHERYRLKDLDKRIKELKEELAKLKNTSNTANNHKGGKRTHRRSIKHRNSTRKNRK